MRIVLYLFLLYSVLFADKFIVSVGGFSACENRAIKKSSFYKRCSYYKQKPLYLFLKDEAPNVNSITLWITKNWKEYWYPAKIVNNFTKNGYMPVFIFYWFGDDIDKKFIKTHEKRYFKALDRFINYLKKIDGKKIVVLNPEYNENGVEKSKEFDILQVRSILKIKEQTKDAMVGICLGDFGNYKEIWDKKNWDLYEKSMRYSSQVSDFIAFQEMRAVTKNSKKDIYKTPFRATAFATYLYKKYKKPIYLAYLAISSYKDEKLQKEVFKNFSYVLPVLKRSANLMGIGIFHYIDVPNHKGYFKKGEKYFGIKRENGLEKPSFREFLKIK